jgi:hypothetical protein
LKYKFLRFPQISKTAMLLLLMMDSRRHTPGFAANKNSSRHSQACAGQAAGVPFDF